MNDEAGSTEIVHGFYTLFKKDYENNAKSDRKAISVLA
jgi:hypothetical protein